MPDDNVWANEGPSPKQDDVWSSDGAWHWDQVAQESATTTAQEGFVVPALSSFQTMDAATAKQLIEAAREHKERARMVEDVSRELQTHNQSELDIRKSWHGVVRHAMKMLFGSRKEDATTSKEYAKLLADTKVLGHGTGNDIALIAHKAGNKMALSDNKLLLGQEQSNYQMQSLAQLQQYRLTQAKAQIDANLEAAKQEAKKPEWLP